MMKSIGPPSSPECWIGCGTRPRRRSSRRPRAIGLPLLARSLSFLTSHRTALWKSPPPSSRMAARSNAPSTSRPRLPLEPHGLPAPFRLPPGGILIAADRKSGQEADLSIDVQMVLLVIY